MKHRTDFSSPKSHQRILLLITARSYRADAFMQAALRAGVEVIPVIDMADELAEFWQVQLGVNFDEYEAAINSIVKFAIRNPVDAILAVDDSGTLLAAKASARLGLPHNSPLAAQAARNKHHMRRLMATAGVPCPLFRRFSTEDDPAMIAGLVNYPCVVKPLTLNGSRGVIRADDAEQFVAAVRRLRHMLPQENGETDSSAYLVEDFIPGFEVALEGMMDSGKLTVLALFDKPDPLDGPFEETIYVTPSRLAQSVQNQIVACTVQAARALGLHMGPVHAELRVNEHGPWIFEIAGRSIGGLCSRTLRFDMDMSLEELILRQACGLPISSTQRQGRASGVMMIPIPEAGVLKGVKGVSAAKRVPGIEDVKITAKLNYPLIPLPEGDSYLGFIFARGDEADEVEAALRTAHNQLHFDIVPEFSLSAS